MGVALAAAGVLVPSALAKRHVTVKLSLVPLPASVIGSAASSLPLQHDSGVVSNAAAVAQTGGLTTGKQLAQAGRITGYRLDYGNPFVPGTGVHEIQTNVDRYKSPADARDGLTLWENDNVQVGVDASLEALRPPALGTARAAYAVTLTIPNASPIYFVEDEIQEGAYLVGVTVSAGSAGAAKQLAPKLTKKIDARMELALEGRLRGTPPKLPPRLKAGPPSTGPDPAKAALAPTDFAQATLSSERYSANEAALSEYEVTLAPADTFNLLLQQTFAESTPSEATYLAALNVTSLQSLAGAGNTVTPVDVSSVGDDAYGALLQLSASGHTIYEAGVVLVNGPIFEVVVGVSKTPLADDDVTNLAQLAASKLNTAVTG